MSARFTLATHNMTEGSVTNEVADCDIVIGQEIDRRKIRAGLPEHRKFFPARDRHQCIAWNPDVFKRDGRGKAIRLHRSGRAEGWPFPSPARYLLKQPLIHRETGLRLTVFGLWLLNSWHPGPGGRDGHTSQREQIALHSLRIVTREVEAERGRGQAETAAGDLNSILAQIDIPGLRHAGPAHGLDRILYTPGPLVLCRVWEGPTTGVGRDMQHKSKHAEFEIRQPKEKS